MRTKRLSPRRLYDLRLASGKSQADVAFELRARGFKADATAISRWERGKHEPGASVVPTLAEVFGVATDELFSDEDDEDSEPLPAATLDEYLRAQIRRIVREEREAPK